MSSSSPQYRYNSEQFRQVFEHSFGYLAGVRRNSQRFASRPALHDPGQRPALDLRAALGGQRQAGGGPLRARRARRGRDRLRPPERSRVRARLDRRAAPWGNRDTDQLPAWRPARSRTCSTTAGRRSSSSTRASPRSARRRCGWPTTARPWSSASITRTGTSRSRRPPRSVSLRGRLRGGPARA